MKSIRSLLVVLLIAAVVTVLACYLHLRGRLRVAAGRVLGYA